MKRRTFVGAGLLLALDPAELALAAPSAPSSPGREHFRFDSGWRFHAGDLESEAGTGGVPITGWSWLPAKTADDPVPPATAAWQTVAPDQDVFERRRGFAWFRVRLPAAPGPNRVAHFESVDDNATVYLNGTKLVAHQGWDDPFDVPLDAAWAERGPNDLVVLVENTANFGGIGEASLQGGGPDREAQVPSFARPSFADSGWRAVHLPHDFVVEGTFDPKGSDSHGYLPMGVGWYRKTFTIPASDRGRRLWIDFDGVYRNSTVWLNGAPIGRQSSGYIGFRVDITDRVNYGGANTLAVRADARMAEGWWYEGGGIYRHVWLNKADPVHVAPCGTYVHSTVSESDGSAAVSLRTTVRNTTATDAECRVTSVVVSTTSGRMYLQTLTTARVPAGQSVDVPQTVTIAKPNLWSPDAPHLYRWTVTIERDGREVDRIETPFGVRTVRFDAEKGMFLNGKPFQIQGTCNHQDFAGVGTAMPDNLLEWRIRKLKEMGSNAYRCSHNPPAAELLDACDRLGMVVLDETRHLADSTRPKTATRTPYSDLSELKSMVLRDRNHPSIIAWCFANEEPLQASDEGAAMFVAMKEAVLPLDASRPFTTAMNGGFGRGFTLVQDLQGFNYNPRAYDGFHRDFPKIPVFGSETASAVSTRGIYANDPVRGYVSAYDVNAPSWAQPAEVAWKALAERPFMAGGFVWTGFDYRGEPTPYRWPCINSHFGIMDMCGFPKDTYYYYQSWWSDKTVLHVLPHWNWPGKEGQEIDVWCHSNCETVELLRNGTSLGTKPMPRNGHLEWKVAYAPGKLEARGFRNGKRIATKIVETTGAPAALRLSTDQKAIVADGESVLLASVDVLDDKGRVVPTAAVPVTFSVTGPAVVSGVGNGDPSSHEPDRASRRSTFNGRCMVVVQVGYEPGAVTVSATAPGLKPSRLTVTTRAMGKDAAREWR